MHGLSLQLDARKVEALIEPAEAMAATATAAPETSTAPASNGTTDTSDAANTGAAVEAVPDIDAAAAYARKLADTSIVLSAREEKILLLTKANDELAETNAALRSHVLELEAELTDGDKAWLHHDDAMGDRRRSRS